MFSHEERKVFLTLHDHSMREILYQSFEYWKYNNKASKVLFWTHEKIISPLMKLIEGEFLNSVEL